MSKNLLFRRLMLFCISSFLLVQNLKAQDASVIFDGVDDYVQTDIAPIAGGSARTIEAWIKTTSNTDPTAGGVQNVIVDMGVMTTGGRFTFNLLNNNAIRLEVQGNGLSGTIPVNDGSWHHVAGVYNPLATNKVSLYVDGVLDVTVTPNTSATGDIVIGRRVDGINRFKGNIDEVRIWNVAKTITEINASKNAQLCNSSANLYAYFPMNDGVPNGNNLNAVIYDQSSGFKTGTFVNFDLTGNISNFSVGKSLGAGMTVTKINRSVCSSYTWPLTGLLYSTPGTYSARLIKSNGCDSIVRMKLSILSSITVSDTVSACDTFTWALNGKSYPNSGVYTDTTLASGGCDSIVTLVLTVGTIPPTYQTHTACDSYTWAVNGITYTNSTITSYTYTNSRGCDSVVYLNLTINKSSSSIQNINACDSYTWSANNQTYTSSGQYFALLKNDKGCDSNLTINLTISNSYKIIDNINACVEFVWNLNGKKYTESIRDSVVFQTAKGCDSILVLNLKIKKVDVGVIASALQLFAQYSGGNYQWIDCTTLNNIPTATNQSFFPNATGTYAVIVTANGCSDTSACYYFVSHVGIDQHTKQVFSVYPNPSNNVLFVKGINEQETASVKIFNIEGVLIQDELAENNKPIDVSGLAQGVYIISINNYSYRFIKL